uniref:Uncharacterized protein n=1 Tax=Arundo donax TaxID=35708 RepID=A0A0A9GVR3_ARUDO
MRREIAAISKTKKRPSGRPRTRRRRAYRKMTTSPREKS